MQSGLYGADRCARKLLNFCKFIALGVVQKNDSSVLVAELGQGLVEPLQLFGADAIVGRIVGAWQAGEAFAGKRALFDSMHAATREPAPLVDKQVVHDPAQPRAGFVDLDEIVELGKCLDQQLLEQVLGFGPGARESPCEAVQPVEVRPDETLEGQIMFSASHNSIEFKVHRQRGKDPIGVFMHPYPMNKKFLPAIVGVAAAIAVTTAMDASGYSLFSALPLFPLALLFWYAQRIPRRDIGLVLGPAHTYGLALAYPVLVLGAIGVIAFMAGAIDTSGTDWEKALLNVGLMSTTGILMGLITEEGFFRGWLWASLRKAGQTELQVLLWTSLAFTVWHISAITLDTEFSVPPREIPIYLVNATLLGLNWGMLRALSGSIVVPSVCHAVWNGIDYPLFGFGEKSGALGIEQTHIFGPEVGWMGIVFNLAVAAMLFALLRRQTATD